MIELLAQFIMAFQALELTTSTLFYLSKICADLLTHNNSFDMSAIDK